MGIVDGSFCSFPSLLLASSFLLILIFPSPVSSIHPWCRRFDSLCRRCRWALIAVLVVWPPHLLVIFHLLRLVYLLLVMSPFIGMLFSPSSRASPPPSPPTCIWHPDISIPGTCVNHIINPHRVFPTTQKKEVLLWCRGWLGLVIGSLVCRGCRMRGRGSVGGRGCWGC